MSFDEKNYWYIACSQDELKKNSLLRVELFDEPYLVFRKSDGSITCLSDRCAHRAAPLSCGKLEGDSIRCGYHGWLYTNRGTLQEIPSCRRKSLPENVSIPHFPVREHEGYIFIRPFLAPEVVTPFEIPEYCASGWAHIRLKNFFNHDVTTCLQNFLDVPHTAWVHPTIFRNHMGENLELEVERKSGKVITSYLGEKSNFGMFSRFLNPEKREVTHLDTFHSPNISCVYYHLGQKRQFYITSQAIPTGYGRTTVYTDLTYNYGFWNTILKPVIRWHAQVIIKQDIEILGKLWNNSPLSKKKELRTEADLPHIWIESLRKCHGENQDPRKLPPLKRKVEICV